MPKQNGETKENEMEEVQMVTAQYEDIYNKTELKKKIQFRTFKGQNERLHLYTVVIKKKNYTNT